MARKAPARKTKKSEAPAAFVPGSGERVAAMASLMPSRQAAAEVAQISVDTLQRYIREEGSMSFEPVARLAFATRTSLDWVATGRLPRSAGLDASLLREALCQVDEALTARAQPASSRMSPQKRAELVTVVYDLLAIGASPIEAGLIQRLMQLATT